MQTAFSFKKPKVAFLDRDGILNVDKGYLYKIEDLEWMPGAKMAVELLCNIGYVVVVVTNQSGIARGYYTVEDMEKLHRHMAQEIFKAGGCISHFYYCPHYKDGVVPEYAVDCNCRKPKPGMILQGLKDFHADMTESFVIGDSQKDIDAAHAAGLKGFLYMGGPKGDIAEFVWDALKKDMNLRDSLCSANLNDYEEVVKKYGC
jgi:D-glycero-D-manno-heptose 1,7-bisphosphate phosphatase